MKRRIFTPTLDSRSGVTLVELLVVMLIAVILAITLVPFLRDYIVRARYVSEGVPVIGDMRTKIQLYQYEPGSLPGLKDNGGSMQSQIAGAAGTSQIQTWVVDTTKAASSKVEDQFELGIAIYAAGAAGAPGTYTTEALAATESRHFGNDLAIETQHLVGRRLRPNHVFYQGRQSPTSTGYAYAVGVFGDGTGLNAGSGYAVLEVYNPDYDVNHRKLKLVAEWRRFVERGAEGSQIPLVSATEYPPAAYTAAAGRAALEAGVCHVGNLDALIDPTSSDADISAQLTFLEAAGWEFQR